MCTRTLARSITSRAGLLASAALLVGLQTSPVHAAGSGPIQPSVWQHHQESTAYFGQTSVFTCSGIEEAVKQVLLYFGARPDLRVYASCPDLIHPVPTAVVHSDFYSLEPAADPGTDTLPGQWIDIRLMPQTPRFMDRGECELVDQLKDLLTKSFSLRDVRYYTACMPHDITLADYHVQAKVLEPVKRK